LQRKRIEALAGPKIVIGLSAVVVAVGEDEPFVLATAGAGADRIGLPFGAFDPAGDRTLELTLRRWVAAQTGFEIGYAEQLYTFADRGREAPLPDIDGADRVISIGYLALTPDQSRLATPGARWRRWYDFFPWEDWRSGRPGVIDAMIAPALLAWANAPRDLAQKDQRLSRARLAFALDGLSWNEERALERYELLYEAGLAPEAETDRLRFSGQSLHTPAIGPGEPMRSDHRRILATAIGRLRGKLKYRPVVFELAPQRFTLLRLQRIVEAISGLTIHKQNFRRFVERSGLVAGLGEMEPSAGGRPAELFRFRREALIERPTGGVHVPTARGD
jgi:hypothetical protein